MKTYTTYTIQDYEGEFNILKHEKILILLALAKTNGNMKEAHKLLCPQPKPCYSYSYIQIQVRRHDIDISELKDELNLSEKERAVKRLQSIEHQNLVQDNLKIYREKHGIKLRSEH